MGGDAHGTRGQDARGTLGGEKRKLRSKSKKGNGGGDVVLSS